MAWRGSPAAGMFRGQPCITTGRHRCAQTPAWPPWVPATTPPLEHIRKAIAESRFTGEGYRKIWARLRFSGVRSSSGRVRRLMRENGLLAPYRIRKRPDKAHDGTITTEAVDVLWGTDMTQSVTLAEGVAHVFVAVHHCKVGLYRIDGGDTGRLVTLIEAKRAHAEKKLGRAMRVVCCYEAGHDGFWLHRFLLARGIDNRVLDLASILVDRRARRAKTDRLDAAALLRTLMALERGERQVCRVVHVPTVADEDRRRLSRERERLLKGPSRLLGRGFTVGRLGVEAQGKKAVRVALDAVRPDAPYSHSALAQEPGAPEANHGRAQQGRGTQHPPPRGRPASPRPFPRPQP
jgi:hypothetical protein